MKGKVQLFAANPVEGVFAAPNHKVFERSDPKMDQQLTVECHPIQWIIYPFEERQKEYAQLFRSLREKGLPVVSSCWLQSVRHPAGAQLLVVVLTWCKEKKCRLPCV